METDFLAGKHILITGHTGYLGSALTSRLAVSRVAELKLLSRQPDSWHLRDSTTKLTYLKGDVTQPHTWPPALDGVDYVFHLAALEINRDHFDPYADLNANFMAVMHMLRACSERKNFPRIIFSSSANIAGMAHSLPVNESAPDDPCSIWSLHKLLAEQYLAYYAKHESMQAISLRLANVYGPTSNSHAYCNMTLNRVTYNAVAEGKMGLYPNKACLRDFLHIDDAIRALILAARSVQRMPRQNYFYVGSGEGVSFETALDQIKKSILKRLGQEVIIQFQDRRLDPLEMRSFVADPSAFMKAADWTPLVRVNRGLDENVKYAIDLHRRSTRSRSSGV